MDKQHDDTKISTSDCIQIRKSVLVPNIAEMEWLLWLTSKSHSYIIHQLDDLHVLSLPRDDRRKDEPLRAASTEIESFIT